jgi:serine/threonine protein kinase
MQAMVTPRAAVMMKGWVIFFVCLLSGSLVAAQTDPVETSALLTFKSRLDDPSGALETWTAGSDPCGLPWNGVYCMNGSDYAHVIEIRLLNNNLGGTLVPELGNLKELKILDVMWNRMSGTIPATIGNLYNMVLLLLNGNQFTGPLPNELGNLQKMIRIQLDQNNFTGPIPPTFSNLTSIQHLHLNNNSFSGTVPKGLGSLPQLVHVLLDSNNLTGALPEDLANATQLLIIQLDNNQLNATIPTSYAQIPTLLKLSLKNCGMYGPIPSFAASPLLGVLDLSLNNLSGPLPNASYSANMTTIDFSYNQITGTVPASFGDLSKLQYLSVRNNMLSGNIPANLGTGASFSNDGNSPVILDFQNNNLSLAGDSILTTLSSTNNVRVWLAGNPQICIGAGSQYTNPWCVPGNTSGVLEVGQTINLTSANSQCSPCNSPYEIVPSVAPDDCRCAAPVIVKYRLKSPGFLVFDLYEQDFIIYIASGLNLLVDQVAIQDYQYQPGPRIAITILLFPAGPVFNDTELNTLYYDFTDWQIPDSSLFGPYELIQYIPPGTVTSGGGSSGLPGGAIAGIVVAGVIVSAVLAAALMFHCLRRYGWDPKAAHRRIMAKTGLRKMIKVTGVRTFTFEEMVKATGNFHDKDILGQGGYGKVYFGTLEDGQKVAIKRAEEGSLQGANEFETEIQLLSRVHHRNLVSLVGYCNDEGEHSQGEQMLVYEYMANGTLRDHLRTTKLALDIVTRLRIALGSARGIHYLHTQADPPIFHRDIKASNILLDEKFNAKVADFGLSKLAPADVDFEGANAGHVSTMVKGTPGYLDPEYFLTHKLTDKSDVYSFGVVLLELVTGMPPIHQGKNIIREVNAACSAGHLSQIIDPRMGAYPIETVEPLCKLALACCHSNTDSRPSMAEVLHELEEIWKETPWSDVGSHSYVTDTGSAADVVFPVGGKGFSTDMYEDISSNGNNPSDLLSRTNMHVLPR